MKAKIKSTGEVIEVLQTIDIITKRGVERQYVDTKRSWCTYVQSELEFIKEEPCKTIDWEQRRYEIAKEAICAIMSNEEFYAQVLYEGSELNGRRGIPCNVSHAAVVFADALIAELKKVEEK